MKSTSSKQKRKSRGTILLKPPKPTKQETTYWEQVLHDHGLGMRRGEKIGSQQIAYGWNQDRSPDEDVVEDDYSEESLP